MKKIVCLLLCMSMLLGCGITNVWAINYDAVSQEESKLPTSAKPSEIGTVLFSDDFESYLDGQALSTNSKDKKAWTKQSNAATTKIAAFKDETGMVMRYTNTNPDGSNSPRFEKHMNWVKFTNMTLSFRLKTGTNKLAAYVSTPDGQTTFMTTKTDGLWANFQIDMNLVDCYYTIYKDGKEFAAPQPFKGGDFSEVQMAFASTLKGGDEAYIDDIVLSTTDNLTFDDLFTEERVITPEEALKGFDKTPAPTLSVPNDKYTMFTYDCSLNGDSYVPIEGDAKFSKISTEFVKPVLLDKEKVIRVTNTTNIRKTPRIEKKLTLGKTPTTVTVEYYAQLAKSGVNVYMYDTDGKEFAASKMVIQASGESAWDLIKYTFDFKNKTVTAWRNGKEMDKQAFSAATDKTMDVTLCIFPVLESFGTILLDNFIMYADAEPEYGDEKYIGSTITNWAKIGEPVTEKSYVSNLNPHPRMFINSRSEVTDKIANDAQCAVWYDKVHAEAEKLLNEPYKEYEFSNGRNILAEARAIERRLMTLGFTYLVEQDKKYVERGLGEIRHAGTFPDWSNNAPMIAAELMYGIACFYDWCYDALTAQDKKDIIDIVKKQALWQFARSYDGVLSAEIAKGTSNRTMIANASAAGIAIAIADEEPQLAEFLLTRGILHGKQPVEAFGADGGFPEGSSYWGLATEYMVYMLAQLESAFKPEFEKPEEITWFFDHPAVENMGDYWVYTAGPDKSFNFGDADEGTEADPTPYWLAAHYNNPLYNWAIERLETNKGSINYPYFAVMYKDVSVGSDVSGAPLDKTFNAKDDAQVATFRSSWSDKNALYAAMQGGKNTTGHMFKSLGTFVIDANGKRFIRTIGRTNYSAMYEQSMYYNERAEGQNTLVVNPGKGWDQAEAATAKFIRHEEAENEAFSILDMTETSPDFVDAKRGMYMTKGRNSVVLQDEVKMKKPSELWWFAHTDGEILLSKDSKSALLELAGKKMYVAITEGPADAVFDIMPAKPLPTSPVAPDETYRDIYKLVIHMSNVTEATLAVEFVPLNDGEVAPERLTPVTPMAQWSVSDNSISVARQAGDTVAMLLGSPVVLSKGTRTYVDTMNMDVYPFTDNGRTLVPVRFISESFGAQVGWNAATESVTVNKGKTNISLQIGSDKMVVNGEERVLDVPAQTYNDRTLIPLRALVEALGKQVLWDDRGLIVISDKTVEYTEAEKSNIISLLTERVQLNGTEMKNFTIDKTSYTMLANDAIPAVTLASDAPVAQNGNVATFTIGEKLYTITFAADKFEGQTGTYDPNGIRKLKLSAVAGEAPTEPTWQEVEHVTFSAGHEKYLEFGTLDNVISDELVNRWSAASPAWICYEFAEPTSLYAFGLAGLKDNGKPRGFIFNAEVSMDGITWEQVLDTQTSGTTLMPDIFKLDGKVAKYFRINGKGDVNGGAYNSYTEVRFYTSEEQMNLDMYYWPVYFAEEGGLNGAVGESKKINVKATNSSGKDVPTDGVVYTTSDASVATVDANGVVTFTGKGEATITATYEGRFETVTATIKAIGI